MSDISAESDRPGDDLAMLAGDPELAGMFITEALDHLSSIEALVLRLESTPGDTDLLNAVFRPFHTIKGNAGALGLTSLQSCAHTVETLLDAARSGRLTVGSTEIEIILRAVDVLGAMIASVRDRLAGRPAASVEGAHVALVHEIDGILQSSDRPASNARVAVAKLQTAELRSDSSLATVKVETQKLDGLVDLVGELMVAQSMIRAHPVLARTDEPLGRALAQLARVTGALQQTALGMRMTPLRQTFQKLARLVRDLARQSGKAIELDLAGEDTELDRKVIEAIQDPLMHMVRNSIDHGIEPSASRTAVGKPGTARLSIRAYHEAGAVVIAIADDGAGLPTGRIRAKAVAKGLIAPDAAITAQEIHDLIFRAGFSTADRVTEISGRGVGMDVVRRNIDLLHGRVDVHTVEGQGTTFRMRVPLTLAILHGLLVRVGDDRFVLPTSAIRESLRPVPGQIRPAQGSCRFLDIRHHTIPLARLGDVLGFHHHRRPVNDDIVVVIEDGGREVALAVDELHGTQDVVIKPLGAAFNGVRGIAGAAVLADGRVGLILDPAGLVGLIDNPAIPEAA